MKRIRRRKVSEMYRRRNNDVESAINGIGIDGLKLNVFYLYSYEDLHQNF